MPRLFALIVLTSALALAGCHNVTHAAPVPVHGFVTELSAFDVFIGTHPTPEQFRAAYPDVQLVMPGSMTTMEFRPNNSRYFTELDKDGRITGGHFG
jgi:hypothetical protein